MVRAAAGVVAAVVLFFTGLGKGEDLMEGGRGVLPPLNCGGNNYIL